MYFNIVFTPLVVIVGLPVYLPRLAVGTDNIITPEPPFALYPQELLPRLGALASASRRRRTCGLDTAPGRGVGYGAA